MMNTNFLRSALKNHEHWIEPDAFLRYWPIIRRIRREKNSFRILEVGSGKYGITTYLSRPCVKVDIVSVPSGRNYFVQADAAKLPFRDHSFDLVFSADLLEHVAPCFREELLRESIRVARRAVIHVFPCGERAREQDLSLAEHFFMETGRVLNILEEHKKLPFPEESDIRRLCGNMPGKMASWNLEKSFNLGWREKFMQGWLFKKVWVVFGMRFLLQLPVLFKFFDFGECYRRVLAIEIESGRG